MQIRSLIEEQYKSKVLMSHNISLQTEGKTIDIHSLNKGLQIYVLNK